MRTAGRSSSGSAAGSRVIHGQEVLHGPAQALRRAGLSRTRRRSQLDAVYGRPREATPSTRRRLNAPTPQRADASASASILVDAEPIIMMERVEKKKLLAFGGPGRGDGAAHVRHCIGVEVGQQALRLFLKPMLSQPSRGLKVNTSRYKNGRVVLLLSIVVGPANVRFFLHCAWASTSVAQSTSSCAL